MKLMAILLSAPVVLLMIGCGAEPSHAVSVDRAEAPSVTASMKDQEAAIAALAAMLDLAEAGEWGAYVDDFYGETHKFGGPEDRDALVERFEKRWGVKVVEALRQATGLTPTIDANGRAVFATDDGPVYMLYRHDDGRWTFHL